MEWPIFQAILHRWGWIHFLCTWLCGDSVCGIHCTLYSTASYNLPHGNLFSCMMSLKATSALKVSWTGFQLECWEQLHQLTGYLESTPPIEHSDDAIVLEISTHKHYTEKILSVFQYRTLHLYTVCTLGSMVWEGDTSMSHDCVQPPLIPTYVVLPYYRDWLH